MSASPTSLLDLKELTVDVVEAGASPRRNALACELEENITFSTELLESFSSKNWQAVVYDALVLAAAIEFCDRSLGRSTVNWGRRFRVRIPVHDAARWRDPKVHDGLIQAVNLLTGDDWHIDFYARRKPAESPVQDRIEFPTDAEAVIAFSEGLDSRAVAGLEGKRLGHRLVRVRVGTKRPDIPRKERARRPFAAVPYDVDLGGNNAEASQRGRGFKFNLVAAIGAYLIGAPSVIVPESGQGALAPAAIPVGQGYPDYRNHPVFTACMERFVHALFGVKIDYEFPRLWSTKGETLREYIDACGDEAAGWVGTWSCWQQSRQSSVGGKRRQCGICAACMLRRMSVHAAGQSEPAETYVWENLNASAFEDGASRDFERTRITPAMREYALAGVLHLEHFGALRSSDQYASLKRRTEGEISRALGLPSAIAGEKLDRLVAQHKREWTAFTDQLGKGSFVRGWIDRAS